VRRVLRDDGTLWLNLGDSYAGGGNGRGDKMTDKSRKQLTNRGATGQVGQVMAMPRPKDIGLKPKDLIGIPWRVAFALQADGWYLRQDIIWAKPNPMPESVTDRCTKSHEYIFLLSKNAKYYYDHNAVKEPVAASTIGRGKVDFGGAKGRGYKKDIAPDDPNFRNGSEQWGRTFDYTESCKNGRNRRDVWTVATKPYKEAHFATFPPELIRPCVLAGSPVGGLVLDPFMGAGTVGLVCRQESRKYVGFELNPEYIKLAEKRIAEYKLPELSLFCKEEPL